MDNSEGIKVRVFDLKKGLVEYENIKIIRIVSTNYIQTREGNTSEIIK